MLRLSDRFIATTLGVTAFEVEMSLLKLGYTKEDGTLTDKAIENGARVSIDYEIPTYPEKIIEEIRNDIFGSENKSSKEDTRSIQRMVREIPATTDEVLKALWNLGYIEKDELRQRKWTLSEKGKKHGKYLCMAYPVFDESVYELVKECVERKDGESYSEVLEKQLESVGQEIPAGDFFAQKGLRKIQGERIPHLMAQLSGVDETDIINAAIELNLLKIDEGNNIVPVSDDPDSGVREERNIYFNEIGQKKIYDHLGLSDWYKDDPSIN